MLTLFPGQHPEYPETPPQPGEDSAAFSLEDNAVTARVVWEGREALGRSPFQEPSYRELAGAKAACSFFDYPAAKSARRSLGFLSVAQVMFQALVKSSSCRPWKSWTILVSEERSSFLGSKPSSAFSIPLRYW